MKGGINKVMRNIAASTADSEFEKVIITKALDSFVLETDKSFLRS